jgi:hypothetical protein
VCLIRCITRDEMVSSHFFSVRFGVLSHKCHENRKKLYANRPHRSVDVTHLDGEHVKIERSGKRESESGVGKLFASAWRPNLRSPLGSDYRERNDARETQRGSGIHRRHQSLAALQQHRCEQIRSFTRERHHQCRSNSGGTRQAI